MQTTQMIIFHDYLPTGGSVLVEIRAVAVQLTFNNVFKHHQLLNEHGADGRRNVSEFDKMIFLHKERCDHIHRRIECYRQDHDIHAVSKMDKAETLTLPRSVWLYSRAGLVCLWLPNGIRFAHVDGNCTTLGRLGFRMLPCVVAVT